MKWVPNIRAVPSYDFSSYITSIVASFAHFVWYHLYGERVVESLGEGLLCNFVILTLKCASLLKYDTAAFISS